MKKFFLLIVLCLMVSTVVAHARPGPNEKQPAGFDKLSLTGELELTPQRDFSFDVVAWPVYVVESPELPARTYYECGDLLTGYEHEIIKPPVLAESDDACRHIDPG